MAATLVDENKGTDQTNKMVCETNSFEVRLSDLKVADLKFELEKRNLDKTGIKSALVERLKNALLEEGQDPKEFSFEAKSPSKKRKSIECETNDKSNDDIANEQENNENKINSEVTLQLSVDEDEAQLNEDENLLELPKAVAKIPKEELTEVNINSHVKVETVSPTSVKELKPEISLKASAITIKKEIEDTIIAENVPAQSPEKLSSVPPKILKTVITDEKSKIVNSLAKSLCITGLPITTKAADLKILFSTQGRVLSVKIIKSTKQTPGKCYGIVTMANNKDATKAIQNLHRTEVNGRPISVEKSNQAEPTSIFKKTEPKLLSVKTKKPPLKKDVLKSTTMNTKAVPVVEKKIISKPTKPVEIKLPVISAKAKEEKKEVPEKAKSKDREKKSGERSQRPTQKHSFTRPHHFTIKERHYSTRRHYTSHSAFSSSSAHRQRSNITMYARMREDRIRLRDREADKRRAIEISRHKYMERKHREEALQLAREKEHLRIERELLERERVEILRLERERQRLERERLEQERAELRKRAVFQPSVPTKRPFHKTQLNSESLWMKRSKSSSHGSSSYHNTERIHSIAAPRNSKYPFPVTSNMNHVGTYSHRPSSKSFDASSSRSRFVPRGPVPKSSARREIVHRQAIQRDPVRRVPVRREAVRREHDDVHIQTREVRQVYTRPDLRSNRRSFPVQQRAEKHHREEQPRSDWKNNRRLQTREVATRSTNRRRLDYF